MIIRWPAAESAAIFNWWPALLLASSNTQQSQAGGSFVLVCLTVGVLLFCSSPVCPHATIQCAMQSNNDKVLTVMF
jgi:hypothetical protein